MTQNQSLLAQHSKPKTTAQDFFLHLLSMIALYIVVASFLTVVFQIINTYVPDQLDSYYAAESRLEKLRFGISSLLIAFPVYMGTMVVLARRYRQDIDRRRVAVRRWLISFTLFVAALIMIGDAIALVNSLLSGELKLRFVLKSTSILAVLTALFFYYFQELRTPEPAETAPREDTAV